MRIRFCHPRFRLIYTLIKKYDKKPDQTYVDNKEYFFSLFVLELVKYSQKEIKDSILQIIQKHGSMHKDYLEEHIKEIVKQKNCKNDILKGFLKLIGQPDVAVYKKLLLKNFPKNVSISYNGEDIYTIYDESIRFVRNKFAHIFEYVLKQDPKFSGSRLNQVSLQTAQRYYYVHRAVVKTFKSFV